MSLPRLRLFAAALAVLVVAACSQPPNEEEPTGQQGTVHAPAGAPVMLGATTFFIDLDGGIALRAETVIEAYEGLYLGPISPIAEDGSFTLELPDGTDLPAVLMVDAEDFVYNIIEFATCALDASDPSVKVTRAAVAPIPVPGIALMTVEGLMVGVATAEPLSDAPDFEEVFASGPQTWVYATGPTTVVTDPELCESTDLTFGVDVVLTAGWNQLQWAFEFDEFGDITSVALGNSTVEEFHVMPLGGI